mgnify:CR=1 FL=1
MNEISLNEVYSTLLRVAGNFPRSTADMEDIREESCGADAELARDIELFNKALKGLHAAEEAMNIEQQGFRLVHVRAHAMNIATIFSNLADSIEEVAFIPSTKIEKEGDGY